MKVKELISITFDKVTIYKENKENKENDEGFEDIYKGNRDDIPLDILEMKVRVFGASRKAVIDIEVL